MTGMKERESTHLGNWAMWVLYAVLLLTAAVIVEKSSISQNRNFDLNRIERLQEWTMAGGTTGEKVHLPIKFREDAAGQGTVITCTPDPGMEFQTTPSLMLTLKYCDAQVLLGEKVIFEETTDTRSFHGSEGVKYLFVQMPEDWEGQPLSIRLFPLLGNNFEYEISTPILGIRSDMIYYLLNRETLGLLCELALMFLGLFLLSLHVMKRGKENSDFLVLGILSFSCGLYMISQTALVHLLCANSYLVYSLEFSLLPLIVFDVLLLMKDNISQKIERFYPVLLVLFAGGFLAVQVLNFCFHIEYRKTLFISHAMIVIMAGYLLTAIMTGRKEDRKNSRHMLLLIFPLVAGGIIDLVLYYVRVSEASTIFFKLGVFLFIVLQAEYRYGLALAEYRILIEERAYKELAYKDGLTGLLNRMAYEEALVKLEEKRREGNCPACISVDINYLKQTNDLQGHSAGDRLIRGTSAILKTAAGAERRVYRIGGDEFVILAEQMDELERARLVRQIEEERSRYNNQSDVQVDFAVGSAGTDREKDEDVDTMIRRADEEMYRKKRKMKDRVKNTN